MAEVEIGIGKSARRAWRLDDVAIVPSRRTRDPEDVDISWAIDAYRFALPLLGAAMDGVTSPATAIALGRLGGLGVDQEVAVAGDGRGGPEADDSEGGDGCTDHGEAARERPGAARDRAVEAAAQTLVGGRDHHQVDLLLAGPGQ